MVMTTTSAKQLRRVRTLGRGASGAVVWLATDEASGELVAVKSACAAGGAAAQLQREGLVLQGLSSPHIVPCLGSRAAAGGEYQLLLEFAPGGSLADEAAKRTRNGARLSEREIRCYAGDVARGLAYLHGLSLVHGDVKARNVVIGGDGRARLTDFGCARRPAEHARPIGGTPAFMAPEVARGESQGPAADVWALGCMVVEIATGRAPWSDMDGHDLLAAVHRIGYSDDVPEVPAWMSAEAKDFLAGCFERRAGARSTAAQLVAHPFVAEADRDVDDGAVPAKKQERLFPSSSPRSTLHGAFCDDSDTDDEAADDEMSTGAAERIGALACAASSLPDWDSEEGWIDLQNDHSGTVHDDAPPPAAVTVTAAADYFVWAEPSYEAEQFVATAVDASVHLHLPHVAGVVIAGGASATTIRLRQGSSYLPTMRLGVHEKENPRRLDRHDDDGIQKVGSHRDCNRNRVVMIITMKRISLKKIPSRDHLVGTARTDHVLMPKRNVRSPDSWKRKRSISLSATPLAQIRRGQLRHDRIRACVDGNPRSKRSVLASLDSKVGRSVRRAVLPYGVLEDGGPIR